MTTLATTIALDAGPKDDRHQALFWRSPFAVTAGAVLSAQVAVMALAAMSGRSLPYEFLFCLTCLSAVFLVAGIWPNWNYLSVTRDGIDQQAGLRSLTLDWSQVQSVRGFDGWVELRIVTGKSGARRVRTAAVFDRYGLGAEAFLDLIETPWLKARRTPGL